MSTAPIPSQKEEPPRSDDAVPPVPDEAGPHDVPDEQVIEHTLPAKKRDEPERPR